MRQNTINITGNKLKYPLFLPDATLGTVRSVDFYDLAGCGIQSMIMNVFHLMQRPGSTTIKALGGLHKMTSWNKPIFTDSGGFQILSIIKKNKKLGSITDNGIKYNTPGKNGK